MEKRKRQQELEFVQMDLLERNYLDFDVQYHDYIGEQTTFVLQEWERFEELLVLLESEKLLKAINRLKERDKSFYLPEYLVSLHLRNWERSLI